MYDLLVIGAGIAGYTAAIRGAKDGLRTAVVESGDIGGTCLNRGCIPTKYMLAKAHQYRGLRQGMEEKAFEGNLSVNYEKLRTDMLLKTEKLSSGINGLLCANGVTVYHDRAEFLNENSVMLYSGNKQLKADSFIIATGSVPRTLPVYGKEEKIQDLNKCRHIFTTDNIFSNLQVIPKSMIILGGGAVGLEFAFMFSGFGSMVTIIEERNSLFGNIDPDIDTALFRRMKECRIDFRGGCETGWVEEAGSEAVVYDADGRQMGKAEAVLMAVGRNPSYEGLRIERAGIIAGSRGIETDNFCQTNVKNIYAVGDVNGKCSLAYAAAAQAENVVSKIKGGHRTKDESLIPVCIFTDPEIAFTGYTAGMQGGKHIKTEKFLMTANGRSTADGNGGFIRLTADSDSQMIMGGVCVCHGASELISQITLAVRKKMTLDDFAETIFPHPTYSEALGEAAERINGRCIYML